MKTSQKSESPVLELPVNEVIQLLVKYFHYQPSISPGFNLKHQACCFKHSCFGAFVKNNTWSDFEPSDTRAGGSRTTVPSQHESIRINTSRHESTH